MDACKPVKKTYQSQYWDCGKGPIKGHRHQSIEGATNCINKNAGAARTKPDLGPRNEDIYLQRREGKTYSSIAAKYNLSANRVRQIYLKLNRLKNKKHDHPRPEYAPKRDMSRFEGVGVDVDKFDQTAEVVDLK